MDKKIILALLLIFISVTTTDAKELLNTSSDMISKVDNNISIGIYVLNIGKYDISTGSFIIDFYLSMKCVHTCPAQDFEFMNGRATNFDKIIDDPNEKFYRIQANLNSPVNLQKFPFDSQEMQIILEDKKMTVDSLTYIPNDDMSGIDDSITFTGWKIGNYTSTIKEHEYKVYDETYSQYVFTIPIYRIRFNSILKTFLPIIFIVLVMLSSFVLDPDKIPTRIAMVSSALVASVMFHVSIGNQIPATSYLTFIDKFMILTYLIILLSFVFNVVLLELTERKKTDIVEKFHRSTEFWMLILVPIIYAILFIVLLR